MPLRDHFRAPLDDITGWESFHAQWPAVIVQVLGRVLPAGYVAVPRAHLGSEIEIDVATFDRHNGASVATTTGSDNGGVATSVWAPPQPTLAVETELPDIDEYEVRVYDIKRGRRLVAAIELVSPGNKDRPEHRRLFVAKCAALVQQQISLAIVDIVTVRDFNFYAELLNLLNQSDSSIGDERPQIYAVACRWQAANHRFEGWNRSLSLGQPLPTLPLWLTDDLVMPLELEVSYEQTCRDLRIT